jgi:hypothetical protein
MGTSLEQLSKPHVTSCRIRPTAQGLLGRVHHNAGDAAEGVAVTIRGRAGTVLLVALLAGCGGSNGSETLVGEWELERNCEQIVQGLEDAGLEEYTLEVIAVAEMVPGVVNDPNQFEDPKNPCKGAVPSKHSHFFTAEGQFGSRNEFGQQVDAVLYEVIDDDSFVLGKNAVFNYAMDGDTITFEPVIPDDCLTEACHENAVLSIGVAFPGQTWHRIG